MSIQNELEEVMPEDFDTAEMMYVEEDLDDDDDVLEDEYSEYDDDDDDDDESEYAEYDDDDDDDDESELLHMLMPAAFRSAKRLFRGKSRRVPKVTRRRFTPYRSYVPRGGVRGGYVMTPRGRVPVRLPKTVVPMATFRSAALRTTKQINGLNSRLNRTQKDIKSVDKKAVSALANASRNKRAITRLSNTSQKQLRRYQKNNKAALEKMKREASSQATTNMMVSMMQNNMAQKQLKDHKHDSTTGDATELGDNNSMMMMLPMLMGGSSDSGDSSDNSMMMMAMMMAMQNQDK